MTKWYNLNQLQSLVTNDVSQQQRLAALESSVAQWLSLSQQAIELHQQDPLAREAQLAIKTDNVRHRQEIQQWVAEMQQQQERSLKLRIEQTQSRIRYSTALESIGTFLTFLVLLSVYLLLHLQTVRRQRAEMLQHKLAQDKKLAESKLEFFSMISHEFRTPLSIIVGSTNC